MLPFVPEQMLTEMHDPYIRRESQPAEDDVWRVRYAEFAASFRDKKLPLIFKEDTSRDVARCLCRRRQYSRMPRARGLLSFLLAALRAEGALETNEIFKWTGLTDCISRAEGWELAAPSVVSNPGDTAPTAMVDPASLGGTPYCKFNGVSNYLAIKSTTGDPSEPREKTSIVMRSQFTVSMWLRTLPTSGPAVATGDGELGGARLLLDCGRRNVRRAHSMRHVAPPPSSRAARCANPVCSSHSAHHRVTNPPHPPARLELEHRH